MSEAAAPAAPSTTYYDLPVVKAAPWKWYIAGYFYAGGVAGASAALAAAIDLAGGRALAPLGVKLRRITLVAEAVGSALLIADLGKPARFYRMMMAVRPTSPMSVGTWILTASGATTALGVLGDLRGREPSRALGIAGALTGGMLATYTGVLVGNTAIPAWHQTREQLPFLFAASSAASAAALLELLGSTSAREAAVVRVFSVGAKLGEVVAARAVARAAGNGVVGKPFREGLSGALWRGAMWLQLASVATTIVPFGGRTRTRIAGALGTIAGVALRFAILEVGSASAADPRATFEPQRAAIAGQRVATSA